MHTSFTQSIKKQLYPNGKRLVTALMFTGILAGCFPFPVATPAAIIDIDNDTILDDADNCPTTANTDQIDADADGLGAVCDTVGDNDKDNDTVLDGVDTCPLLVDATNNVAKCTDSDSDTVVDFNDACPNDNRTSTNVQYCTDGDSDTVMNFDDNCPTRKNTAQNASVCADTDADGLFDASADSTTDVDNCPAIANPLQEDFENDSIGDACDPDKDGDGIANAADIKSGSDPVQDCSMNAQASCNAAAITCLDADNDGVSVTTVGATGCGNDNCPDRKNASQNAQVCADTDADGVFNASADGTTDADNCISRKNATQDANVCADTDGDLVFNASQDGTTDADNCPSVKNGASPNHYTNPTLPTGTAMPSQSNFDGDANGGDACDTNADNDIMLASEEWPGCDVNTTTNSAGFLSCGNDVNAEVQAAFKEWYAQITCHRTNNATCDANPDGTGNFNFSCNRTGGSGGMTWAINTTTATQTWNSCRYVTENTEIGTTGIAGYDLTINGPLVGTVSGTAGTVFQKGTLTAVVNGGTPSFATSGSFTATLFDKRDIHKKIPVANDGGTTDASFTAAGATDTDTGNHSSYMVVSCPKAIKGCDGTFRRYNTKTIGAHSFSGLNAALTYEAAQSNAVQSP